MRVLINGTCGSAARLRSLIQRDPDLVIGATRGDFAITVEDGPVQDTVLDGVDGELERLALRHIGELVPSGRVLVRITPGQVRREDAITVTVPAGAEDIAHAVEHGLYRALLEAAQSSLRRQGQPRPWWKWSRQ